MAPIGALPNRYRFLQFQLITYTTYYERQMLNGVALVSGLGVHGSAKCTLIGILTRGKTFQVTDLMIDRLPMSDIGLIALQQLPTCYVFRPIDIPEHGDFLPAQSSAARRCRVCTITRSVLQSMSTKSSGTGLRRPSEIATIFRGHERSVVAFAQGAGGGVQVRRIQGRAIGADQQ